MLLIKFIHLQTFTSNLSPFNAAYPRQVGFFSDRLRPFWQLKAFQTSMKRIVSFAPSNFRNFADDTEAQRTFGRSIKQRCRYTPNIYSYMCGGINSHAQKNDVRLMCSCFNFISSFRPPFLVLSQNRRYRSRTFL